MVWKKKQEKASEKHIDKKVTHFEHFVMEVLIDLTQKERTSESSLHVMCSNVVLSLYRHDTWYGSLATANNINKIPYYILEHIGVTNKTSYIDCYMSTSNK